MLLGCKLIVLLTLENDSMFVVDRNMGLKWPDNEPFVVSLLLCGTTECIGDFLENLNVVKQTSVSTIGEQSGDVTGDNGI